MIAIGNSEPLPDNFDQFPIGLQKIIRDSRTKAGWCDCGKRFGDCEVHKITSRPWTAEEYKEAGIEPPEGAFDES